MTRRALSPAAPPGARPAQAGGQGGTPAEEKRCSRELPAPLAARVRTLSDAAPDPQGRYVLCWLQQALRAMDNPALDVAVTRANALGLPCLVHVGIREDTPYASDRLHHFRAGASATLEKGLAARGIACATHLNRPSHDDPDLILRLAGDAALVVTDDAPMPAAREPADRLAAQINAPVWAVDAHRMVPLSLLREDIRTTKGFRAAHKPLRDDPAARPDDVAPDHLPYDGPLCFTPDRLGARRATTLAKWIAECRIDHSLPPVERFEASQARLDALLDRLIDTVLPVYKWRRNNPADDASASLLSPYLHFGMIGPRAIAARIAAAEAPANCKWKFLDELLTWREWFAYLAVTQDAPASYGSVSGSARETLAAHADDPRDTIYSLDDLIHGRTDDETWNAAQRQFLADGYMHNNLRMYWGKRIIGWTPSPEAAWSTACYLNDRLSYDGRDPATYGNMGWVFGQGRPAYREAPVYGWIAPKSDRALRRRPGAAEWLAREAMREGPQVTVPDTVPDYTGSTSPHPQ